MNHRSKLIISLEVSQDDNISDVLAELPSYCSSTFQCVSENRWIGEFQITCPSAPELAEGDFVDDLCPYFPALLKLKNLYSADFVLHIAVGAPAEESWELESYSVALLAALGASISIQTAAEV